MFQLDTARTTGTLAFAGMENILAFFFAVK